MIEAKETNWSFIENLLKLRFLFIRHARFSDLSPIANLCRKQRCEHEKIMQETNGQGWLDIPHLENLYMAYCGITDISPLAEYTRLSELNLSHNDISDLTPISKMKTLYWLTLRYNKITNINPLKALKGTYYINLRHNQITDISVFGHFKNYYIGRLFLEHNPIADFSPLRNVHLVDCDFREYTKKGMFITGMKVNADEVNDLI